MYPILASRGCPYVCLRCKKAAYAKITRFRIRSVAVVMDEIRWARRRYGAGEIQFSGATFGLRRSWVFDLCDAMETAWRGLTWSVLSRVDVPDPSILKGMAAAGCWNVLYGIESANQHTLRYRGEGDRSGSGPANGGGHEECGDRSRCLLHPRAAGRVERGLS